MDNQIKIKLSVEEAIEFQKFDAEAEGFVRGVRAAADFFKRQKLDAMLAARLTPTASPVTGDESPQK